MIRNQRTKTDETIELVELVNNSSFLQLDRCLHLFRMVFIKLIKLFRGVLAFYTLAKIMGTKSHKLNSQNQIKIDGT